MITSNQNYGIKFEQLKHCDLIKELEINDDGESKNTPQRDDEPKFSFLYTRESDRTGAGVEVYNSPLAKAFDKEKSKRKKQLKNMDESIETKSNNPIISTKQIKSMLDKYQHEPKSQNPLYSTTSNDIGIKKPSQATAATMSYSRSQSFSKSFNRIMFQDLGLNTSLTRSNVHESLDTDFV
jgi:hypothetical protein